MCIRDRPPVEDTDDRGRLRPVAFGEPRPQRPADLLRILGRGHLAGADRPHRLVGQDDPLALARGGELVGGASLDADEFAQICRIAAGGS